MLPQGGEQGLNQGLPERPSRGPHWKSGDLVQGAVESVIVSLSESSNLLPVMQKRQQPVMEGAEEEGSRQATVFTLRARPTLRRQGRGSAPSLAHRCLPSLWPRRQPWRPGWDGPGGLTPAFLQMPPWGTHRCIKKHDCQKCVNRFWESGSKGLCVLGTHSCEER